MTYDNDDGPIYSVLNGKTTGYLLGGNATTFGTATTGVYCDTGITNSDGIPIYRYATGDGRFPYNYLIRLAGASSTRWFVVVSNSANKFSQNVKYLADDGYVAWASNYGSGTTPANTGWIGNWGPPTAGSITSVTATTC
jgi:hypothetical protein